MRAAIRTIPALGSALSARRPAPRDSCPAPPAGRPHSFGSTLSPIRPSVLVVRAAVVASAEGGARARPAGNGRSLASRRTPSVLESSLGPAAGKTTHPSRTARPHPAHGRGEPSALWGAPRIHGELPKLGFTVSERTVSRYLRDRPTAPSQTWRTTLVNHLGVLACTSMVTSSYAPSDDDGVDGCGLPFRVAWSLRDGPCASDQRAVGDWPPSLQGTSLGGRVG